MTTEKLIFKITMVIFLLFELSGKELRIGFNDKQNIPWLILQKQQSKIILTTSINASNVFNAKFKGLFLIR